MRTKTDTNTKIIGSERKQFVTLTILLYVFWVILSGVFTMKLLTIGFVTSLIIARISMPLLRLPSVTKANESYAALDIPVTSLLAYLPWLLWEICKANIDVVKLVLNPRMPIQPQVIAFEKQMANPLAHVVLANSITLTPGTVTMDLQEGVYYIHAVNKAAAEALIPSEGEGEMIVRVARIFNEQEHPAVGRELHELG